jgi:hypothetical protein
MRFVVEYKLTEGSRGIMLFTADTETNAAEYVSDMICRYGYAYVSDPIVLTGGIEELYRVTETFVDPVKF